MEGFHKHSYWLKTNQIVVHEIIKGSLWLCHCSLVCKPSSCGYMNVTTIFLGFKTTLKFGQTVLFVAI